MSARQDTPPSQGTTGNTPTIDTILKQLARQAKNEKIRRWAQRLLERGERAAVRADGDPHRRASGDRDGAGAVRAG